MEMQAIVFSKDKFKTPEECEKWLKAHGMKPTKEVHETENSWRYRMMEPGMMDEKSMRTKELTDGVVAVMGKKKM